MNGLWKSVVKAVVAAVATAGVALAGGPGRVGGPRPGGGPGIIPRGVAPVHGPRVSRFGPWHGGFGRGLDGKGDNGLRNVPRHRDAWDYQNNPRHFTPRRGHGVFDPGGWGYSLGAGDRVAYPHDKGIAADGSGEANVHGMDSEVEVIELGPRGSRPWDSPGDDTLVGRMRARATHGFQMNGSGNDEAGPPTTGFSRTFLEDTDGTDTLDYCPGGSSGGNTDPLPAEE